MQVACADVVLKNMYICGPIDNQTTKYPFTSRELVKIIGHLKGLPNISECSKVDIDYLPPNSNQPLHSVAINTTARLYFKQLAEDEILISIE